MPEEHDQDLLWVYNPDIGCEEVTADLHPVNVPTGRVIDGIPQTVTQYQSKEFNHADGFTVFWGSVPFTIRPGEKKIMQRYIAKHFAKHLADHVLEKMEHETGRKNLLNNPIERPKVIKSILVAVYEYYNQPTQVSEAQKAAKQMEVANEQATSLGAMPDPLYGTMKQSLSPEEILKNSEASEEIKSPEVARDPDKPLLEQLDVVTKKELLESCINQGIEVTGKENKETLASKLKSF